MAMFLATTWGSLSVHDNREVGEQSQRCPVRSSPENTSTLQSPTCRNFAGTSANVSYFASAVSCTFALLTAALTAARNESAPAGTCTSPDSVLRKETSLP